MQSLLDNPQFVQQMSSVMADPAILEQVIASSPQLQAMGPRVRELFQSEGFRQMMCVPAAAPAPPLTPHATGRTPRRCA